MVFKFFDLLLKFIFCRNNIGLSCKPFINKLSLKLRKTFGLLLGKSKFLLSPREALINEDFCYLARKANSGRSEVYQDIHELRAG